MSKAQQTRLKRRLLLCGLALPLGIAQCLGWVKAALGRAVFRRSAP